MTPKMTSRLQPPGFRGHFRRPEQTSIYIGPYACSGRVFWHLKPGGCRLEVILGVISNISEKSGCSRL